MFIRLTFNYKVLYINAKYIEGFRLLIDHTKIWLSSGEAIEVAEARIVNDFSAEVDAVGDITVVLIGYCLQRGLDFEQCLESAYNEIKVRTGKVVNGVFVKDE